MGRIGLVLVLFSVSISLSHAGIDCIVRRAALDVGSSGTKLKIADINVCAQKIVEVVHEQVELVAYKSNLINNGGSFSDEIQNRGMEAFGVLKEKIDEFNAGENVAGVATSAFRDATNSEQFIERVNTEYGLNIEIVSQDEEGILGFYAALTAVDVPMEEAVVWDVGSASVQMTHYSDGAFDVMKTQFGHVSFFNAVLREIKNDLSAMTPNPMSSTEQTMAIELAASDARANASTKLVEKISRVGGRVYGIGGTHGSTVKQQVNSDVYGLSDLFNALMKNADKTDEEIESKYPASTVTNLSLVTGYMTELGIAEVQVLDANNALGLLIDSSRYRPHSPSRDR